MSNRFDPDFIDSNSVEVKPKKEAPIGHAKLPDISEAMNLFGKKNDTTSSGTTNPIHGIGRQQSPRTIHSQSYDLQQARALDGSIKSIERTSDGNEEQDEKTKEDIKAISEGREIVVRLDEILVDSSKNTSRAGKAWKPNDPEVIALAMTIKRSKLIHAPEIRPLKEPIERENGGVFRYELVSGYKRYASLQYLKYEEFRFVLFEDLDDDEALIHNGLENWGRSDPTEFDLAVYCSVVAKKRGWNAEHIARRIKAKTGRIETLLLIIDRCPPDLLEAFRLTPTPETRRDLSRVAQIQRATKEETHKAMLEEWTRIQNDRNRTDTSNANNDGGSSPTRNRNGSRGDSKIVRLRNQYAQYSEWFDSSTNTYRTITEEMREFGEQIFRYLQGGSKGEKPFR